MPNLRMPPQDIEAEMAVLGALMLDEGAIIQIADLLIPEDFYREDHRLIYEAMYDLLNQGTPVDIRSVGSRLKEKKQLEKMGGHGYLTELVNCVPSASNVKYYAEIVRKKSVLRSLIEAANHIGQLGYKEEENLDYLLDEAEQKIYRIANLSPSRQTFLDIKKALEEAWERIDKFHASKDALPRGVPTGFPDLDNLLGGLQKSDFVVLAARPSLGKTSLALDIARHASCEHNIPVGFFSLEMSSHQLVDRLLAAEAHVDSWKLRNGKLNEKDDFSRIQDAMSRLSKAPIYFEDLSLSVLQIRAMARRLQADLSRKNKTGLGLVIVDYMQMITPPHDIDNPVQQMTEISRALKNLAKELEVPVLGVSQLSRAVMQRHPPIPRLSDLRESGAIEQDADVILFIYKEEGGESSFERNPNEKSEFPEIVPVEIHIAKHRNGPTGVVHLYFSPKKASFTSAEKANYNVF
jgi:replicative DNA helicase